jgi:excisionase family DNA binding protein
VSAAECGPPLSEIPAGGDHPPGQADPSRSGRLSNGHPSGQAADDRIYIVDQVAEHLQLQRARVYELIRLGDLPAVKIGTRQVRVRASDLDAYLRQRGPRQTPVNWP